MLDDLRRFRNQLEDCGAQWLGRPRSQADMLAVGCDMPRGERELSRNAAVLLPASASTTQAIIYVPVPPDAWSGLLSS